MVDNIESQIRRGLIEYAVLLVLNKGTIYSSDLIQILNNAKLITSEGTIYPLLSRLRSNDYCDYEWVESKGGPPRKYYNLTSKGKEYLKSQETVWVNIVESINLLK
jgi:PadR family transcriptional regulator PadR